MTSSVETGRTAVLIDFGGMVTTSVLSAFRSIGAEVGDAELPLTLLSRDEASRTLLSDYECGRICTDAFEECFARRRRVHGAQVEADGLAARMQANLARDEETIELLDGLRSAGVPVALVSNAFGRDTYAGFDFGALADVVIISSEVGIRKPSRRIYRIACDRLGIEPESAVMVDDLQQNLDGAARLGIAGVLHSDGAGTARELHDRFGLPALRR